MTAQRGDAERGHVRFRHATVTKDHRRTVRPWLVTLVDSRGHVWRRRWFTRHAEALRWGVRKVRA